MKELYSHIKIIQTFVLENIVVSVMEFLNNVLYCSNILVIEFFFFLS